jgi:glycosyltransferase involved in cell wall biosynthesis
MKLGSYRESKILHYDVLKDAYQRIMRLNPMNDNPKVKHLFYTNLIEDFDPKILRVFPNIKYSGVIHDTYFDKSAYGSDEKNQAFEEFVLKVMHKGFTGANYIHRMILNKFPELKDNLVKCFLPKIDYNPHPPKRKYDDAIWVLWNHRVSKPKGYEMLLDFSEKLFEQEKTAMVFIATRGWTPQILKIVNDFQKKYCYNLVIYLNPSSEQYTSLINNCNFGLTTSFHDTFGGSVIECLNQGMPYFVPSDPNCAFVDYTDPEYWFDREGSVEDIIKKMYKFRENEQYREETIARQTQILKNFSIERFVEIVTSELEAETCEGEKIKKEVKNPWEELF